MKTSAWLVALMLTAAWPSAFAQKLAKFRYRHHPSYASRNYKQPDRAALAKKVGWDREQTISLTEANQAEGPAFNRNYKQQLSTFVHLRHQVRPSLKSRHRVGEKGRVSAENRINPL